MGIALDSIEFSYLHPLKENGLIEIITLKQV